MKTCPFCAELIEDAAIKCKHCGSSLGPNTNVTDSVQGVVTNRAKITLPIKWAFVVMGLTIAALCGWAAYEAFTHDSHWSIKALTSLLAFFGLCGAFGRPFKCSYCGKEIITRIYADHAECSRCKVLHLIDWKD